MVNSNIVLPTVQDYDPNMWDGTVNTAFWTNGTNVTEQRGAFTGSSLVGNVDFRTALDIRAFGRICLSVGMATTDFTKGTQSTRSGSVTLELTDGGSNHQTLMLVSGSASNGSGSLTSYYASFATGMITLTNEGGKVRVRMGTNSLGANFSDTNTSGSHTETLIADNTLVDTSAWANVYIRLYTAISNNIGFTEWSLEALEITPNPLGSLGTPQ